MMVVQERYLKHLSVLRIDGDRFRDNFEENVQLIQELD